MATLGTLRLYGYFWLLSPTFIVSSPVYWGPRVALFLGPLSKLTYTGRSGTSAYTAETGTGRRGSGALQGPTYDPSARPHGTLS